MDHMKDVISMGQNGQVKTKVPNPPGSLLQFQSPIVHKSKGHSGSLQQKFNLAEIVSTYQQPIRISGKVSCSRSSQSIQNSRDQIYKQFRHQNNLPKEALQQNLSFIKNIGVKQSRDAYPNVSKRTAIRQIKRTDQKNPKLQVRRLDQVPAFCSSTLPSCEIMAKHSSVNTIGARELHNRESNVRVSREINDSKSSMIGNHGRGFSKQFNTSRNVTTTSCRCRSTDDRVQAETGKIGFWRSVRVSGINIQKSFTEQIVFLKWVNIKGCPVDPFCRYRYCLRHCHLIAVFIIERLSTKYWMISKTLIVKKCKGLPLAVKTLGSLMLTKKKVNEWQLVNDKFMSEMQDNDILPALRLSYDDLPPHMKICFAYCCVFSKGEEMSKDSLIELWMANGFIPSQGDVSLYALGEEIFTCLVRRSFFEDVVEKDIYTSEECCKMHDLMHDLALYVIRHDCAVIEPGKELITSDEVLHLSLSCHGFCFLEHDLKKLRPIRSMLVFVKVYESSIRQISSHVYLRVLCLQGIESSTLPESICKLIHLRYLKIKDSDIQALPDTIIYLQNLQTLILENCCQLRELPKGLRYMRNLQRLDISYCPELQHMPVGIKELTNLRRLSHFVVGKDDGARIGELAKLNLLGWGLKLSLLENVGSLRDAKSANLKDKTNLRSLRLNWSWKDRSETVESEVLEGLEPNTGLQKLTIWYNMGRVISPSWLVKLVNLTCIRFYYLEKCERLPPLGKLPRLKIIILWNMRSLKCFHDDDNATSNDEIIFPSLQELDINECSSLVCLPSNFPKLRSLKIGSCHELRSLPDEIQSLKDLNKIMIRDCKILSRRCEKEIGEDWPKISHIPHLNIEILRLLEANVHYILSGSHAYSRESLKSILKNSPRGGYKDQDREKVRDPDFDRTRETDRDGHMVRYRERSLRRKRGRDTDSNSDDDSYHRSHSHSRARYEHRSRSKSRSPSKRKRVSGFDIAPPASAILSGGAAVAAPVRSSWNVPKYASLTNDSADGPQMFIIHFFSLQSVVTFFSHGMSAIGGNTSGPSDAVVNVYINHEKKFAFVEMRSVEEASSAGGIEGPDRIFVAGIPYSLTDAQIRELLETFGALRGFDLVKDKETGGNSKGYAFYVFQDLSVTDIACRIKAITKVQRKS
ncbi:Disease resistance protein [Artemisia annua]|uniref:Disease resistance protein n=1 Tax=Artemisia annua TaxID=35608 RepID=A0A2U1NMX2_ARTAN|nr:Disease resistance protein [Artemisia annua]